METIEEKFSAHEISLMNIVLAKNDFLLDMNSKKSALERKIKDFRRVITSKEMLQEFDKHFGTYDEVTTPNNTTLSWPK